MYKWLTALGTAFTIVLSSTAATALDVEKHFKGKRITIVLGYGAGGTYGKTSLLLTEFLGKYIPGNPGDIVTIHNKKIGEHDGLMYYTIGQRKGIKIANKEPLYVISIDPDKNEIVVGEKKYLAKNKINLLLEFFKSQFN